jgi:hypothetical protein
VNTLAEKLIAIIEETLDGRMNQKDLARLLPQEIDNGTEFEILKYDIENVIERRPYNFSIYDRDGCIKKDSAYKKLFLDLKLLKSGTDFEHLLNLRKQILEFGIDIEHINEQINNFKNDIEMQRK